MIRIITKAIFCEVEIIILGEKLALAGRQCNFLPYTAEREREKERLFGHFLLLSLGEYGGSWHSVACRLSLRK